MRANGTNGSKVYGHKPANSLRDAKHHNGDWLKSHAQSLSAKDGAALTGMTPAGFENIRQGRSKLTFDNLTEWCRNDPAFAAAYAAHIGLIRPEDAEFAGALTKAVHAYVRRGA